MAVSIATGILGVVSSFRQHRGPLGESLNGFGDPPLGHQLAVRDQGDIVMPLRPVDPAARSTRTPSCQHVRAGHNP